VIPAYPAAFEQLPHDATPASQDSCRSGHAEAQVNSSAGTVDLGFAKLDEAATTLTEDKNADAVQKLTDYQSTLNLLATATKAKVDPTTAQTLNAEAQGVIDCINAIGTDTTTTTAQAPHPRIDARDRA
jgi:hypothetical protein